MTFENNERKYIVTDVEEIRFKYDEPITNQKVFSWDYFKNIHRDATPNTSNIDDIVNSDLNSHYNTTTLTIADVNDYVSISISPSAEMYINGVLKANGSTATNGDVIYFKVTTNVNFSTTDTYTVNYGDSVLTFTVTTKNDIPKRSCKSWYDDGARTDGYYVVTPFANDTTEKTVYCDMTNGGWLLIDSSFPYYAGRECTSGYGIIDNNNIWKLNIDSTSDNPWGSTVHGGCGISTNKKMLFSEIKLTEMVFSSNANCGSVNFPNGSVNIIEDNDGPVSAFTQYHYPGWSYESTDGSIISSSSVTYAGVTGTRTQTASNGLGEYFIHMGIGAYSGCYNRPCSAKVWIR
jgi:hypothetical protein